jgi:hypothetical protein
VWNHRAVSDLVRVYASGDPFEAELLRGRLEAEGIAVLLKGPGAAYPAGPSYLFVAEDDRAHAIAIIDGVRSGVFALDEDEVPPPTPSS